MAVDLEQKVMRQIGLGQHYSWYNGSGSCQYIRDEAIQRLPDAAKENGLDVSNAWLAHLRTASQVDSVNSGKYGLTNVWISCSYAVQDAIYRAEDGKGYDPPKGDDHWHFWSDKERSEWKMRHQHTKHLFSRELHRW